MAIADLVKSTLGPKGMVRGTLRYSAALLAGCAAGQRRLGLAAGACGVHAQLHPIQSPQVSPTHTP